MKKISVCLAAAVLLGCTSASASEQSSNSVLGQRYNFYGGAQIYQAEGKFSLTKEGQPKNSVDLDDLGLDDNLTSPVFGALFNFGPKWTLRVDYFGYHDDAKRTADSDFDFGDVVVDAGAKLDSSLDLDVYVINLAYNLYSTERAKFGVGFGVHLADIDLEIAAQATVGGVVQVEQEDSINETAPLPNLYIAGAYAFTDRFLLRYGGGWMSLSYGDYDGDLVFANVALEYWPFQHAGIGVGYRYVEIEIDYDPGNKKEEYDVKLPGPMVYATVGF